MNAGNKTPAQAGGAVKVAAISDGQPSDAGFQIVSAWLQQEGKSANGDQLYTMCRFADFVLSHAPQPPAGQQDRGEAAPSTALCAVCGLGRHVAAHRPRWSGPNQGEPLDHAFTVDTVAAAPGNGKEKS